MNNRNIVEYIHDNRVQTKSPKIRNCKKVLVGSVRYQLFEIYR